MAVLSIEDKNLHLSVSVENHSYIHFLASNKLKLPTCHSRKLIKALTMSKNSFWTRFCHILAYFYRPYFLRNAKNMPSDFVEYSTSPVEISDLPTKIFEFSKLIYLRPKVRLVQGKNQTIGCFGVFHTNVMFQWLQELSGSSKNSWR